MSGTVVVGALGVASIILIILFIKLGEENGKYRYPLQIVILSFLLGMMILLGKTSIDYKDNCSWLVNNSTISGATTQYQYSYNCSTNTSTVSTSFYEISLWLIRITVFYLFIVFVAELASYVNWKKKGGDKE